MKLKDFQYGWRCANGDIYYCPECDDIILVDSKEESPFVMYCPNCGAEFDIEDENNEQR